MSRVCTAEVNGILLAHPLAFNSGEIIAWPQALSSRKTTATGQKFSDIISLLGSTQIALLER